MPLSEEEQNCRIGVIMVEETKDRLLSSIVVGQTCYYKELNILSFDITGFCSKSKT